METITTQGTAFSVAKTNVELYKIRHPSGCYWADITIDAHGRTGRISIASDFGNWSNYWGACGSDFKSFLGQLNYDYAANKFGAEQWIDVDKSLKEFTEMVKRYKQIGAISGTDALLIREELKELAGTPSQAISAAIQDTDYLYKFLYKNAGEVDYSYRPNPHFQSFWNQVWPVLLAEFSRESLPLAPATPAAGAAEGASPSPS